MAPGQKGLVRSEGLRRRARTCAGAVAVLLAAAGPAAPQVCAGPGREPIVISRVDGWRTLTTDTGLRLTPAGIADFSALSSGAADPVTPTDKVAAKAAARAADRAADRADMADMAGRLDAAFRTFLGRPLRIEPVIDAPDRHGRRPVLIFSGDGLVQAELVARGLAVAYPAGAALPCADRLFAAERLARRAKAGVWARAREWIAPPRPEAFADRMGVFTILEGRVLSVGTRSNRTYLNFGGRWADDVTVEIPAGRRELFGGAAALEALSGKRIRVRGFPVEKSGPMLEVRQPWQIENAR